MLEPGRQATWLYVPLTWRRSLRRPRYSELVTVVAVNRNTAHIRVQRFDGRVRLRWVKLNRLREV